MKAILISLFSILLSLIGFNKASNYLYFYAAKDNLNKASATESDGSNGRQMKAIKNSASIHLA